MADKITDKQIALLVILFLVGMFLLSYLSPQQTHASKPASTSAAVPAPSVNSGSASIIKYDTSAMNSNSPLKMQQVSGLVDIVILPPK